MKAHKKTDFGPYASAVGDLCRTVESSWCRHRAAAPSHGGW
jgi:hypothetical protein